ncbi:MAG: ATP-binding protein [Deltaproteobacteria bacterium]|jgi:hypothetical protein|nr:ATP-binding protein [Deltaproteobacteria bacterium]
MVGQENQAILEIGSEIANFSELRNEGYIYVDKTDFIHKILTGPRKKFFLSRPRRFGKTLLIDTIEEVASGRKELFSGLAIDRLRREDEWTRSHVLRISMNSFIDDPTTLDSSIAKNLRHYAKFRGFTIEEGNSADSLTEILGTICANYKDIPLVTQNISLDDGLIADRKKIIVLIDEYDAPIINNLTNNTKLEIAKETLHGFYNSLKSCENLIERIFITGITKFSQLSLFSAMNNLRDISFKKEYGTICGFTIEEISNCYSQHLDVTLAELRNQKEFGPGFSKKMLMERIIEWYDGYSWNGTDRVINPLSLQNFLIDHEFKNYWFGTGEPRLIQKFNITDDIFSKVFNGSERFTGSVDIQDSGNIDPIPLMLQTGYLTLRKRDKTEDNNKLYLTVPNREVGMSIMKNYVSRHVMPKLTAEKNIFNSVRAKQFCHAFCEGDSANAEKLLQGFLSVIPHSLHRQKEFLYHVILLNIFVMSDYEVDPEQNTGGGIIDLVITAQDKPIFITEVKYAKSDTDNDTDSDSMNSLMPQTIGISDANSKKLQSCVNAAFRQIIEKDYLLPYMAPGKDVRAVAIGICGRNDVRIRSCPAEDLLARASEYLGTSQTIQATDGQAQTDAAGDSKEPVTQKMKRH